jgi:hypothetical protein
MGIICVYVDCGCIQLIVRGLDPNLVSMVKSHMNITKFLSHSGQDLSKISSQLVRVLAESHRAKCFRSK